MIIEINKDNINEIDGSFISKKDILNELMNNPFGHVLALEDNDKIIGYLYYSDIYERVEINQFEVEINNRNCGKGQLLLDYLIKKVDKDISLEVRENNYPAIHLYEKNGFIKCATRSNYYKDGINGLLMVRNKKE